MNTALAMPAVGSLSIERARELIRTSKSADETLRYRAMAKAMLVFQRERDAGLDAEADAKEIVLRATRRIGEQMRETREKGEMATGTKGRALPPGPGRGNQKPAGPTGTHRFCPAVDTFDSSKTLKAQGIDKHLADEARKLAAMPEKDYEGLVASVREQTAARQSEAKRKADERDARLAQRKVAATTEAKQAPERARVRLQDSIDFLDTFKHKSIDLLVTDPPYSSEAKLILGKGQFDIFDFAKAWVDAALLKLSNAGRAYICCGAYPRELMAYFEALRFCRSGNRQDGLDRTQVLVWTYRNRIGPTPTHDYVQNWQAIIYLWGKDAQPLTSPSLNEQFAVQDINAPDGRQGDHWHAWQKPDELARRIITHASKPGDLVVDPFCGTGTFLLAAAKLGRKAQGADVDPKMLALAEQRGCVRG